MDLRQGLTLALPAFLTGMGLRRGGVPAAAGLVQGLNLRADREDAIRAQQVELARLESQARARAEAEAAERQRAYLLNVVTKLSGAEDEESYGALQESFAQIAPQWGVDPNQITSLPGLATGKGETRYLKAMQQAYDTLIKVYGPPAEWETRVPGLLDSRLPVPGVRGPRTVREVVQAVTPISAAGEVVLPPLGPPRSAVTAGSFEDYVQAPPERQAALRQWRKEYQQADDRPRVSVTLPGGATEDDAEVIADAIVAGEQAPDTRGLYRAGVKVRAALARRGYNQAKALQDWQAQTRYLATLNGPTQLRLRQAVNFTRHSLDIIDRLAGEWQAGGFPALNRARVLAARQGVLGPEAQRIATQLQSQIADLTSELGTVYKGGNSSTDESLKLAAENLKTEWSEATLKANVALVRENLRIRENSMNLVGVAGTPQNPYAPPPAAAPDGAAPAAASPVAPYTAEEVARRLTDRPPGRYELKDGSVWFKQANGQLRKSRG